MKRLLSTLAVLAALAAPSAAFSAQPVKAFELDKSLDALLNAGWEIVAFNSLHGTAAFVLKNGDHHALCKLRGGEDSYNSTCLQLN